MASRSGSGNSNNDKLVSGSSSSKSNNNETANSKSMIEARFKECVFLALKAALILCFGMMSNPLIPKYRVANFADCFFLSFMERLRKGCGGPCSYTFCASNPANERFNLSVSECGAIAVKISVKPPSTSIMGLLAPIQSSSSAPKPKYLDIPTLQATIRECEETGSHVSLVRLIGMLFRSSDSLNLSFLVNPLKAEVDGTDFGISIPDIQEAYRLLSLMPETVLNSLNNALEATASELMRTASRMKHPNELRQFILILESPSISEPTSHKLLLGPLLVALKNCPYTHLLETHYFSKWNPDRLRGWNLTLQNLIAFRAIDLEAEEISAFNPHSDDYVIAATEAIGMIHRLNEKNPFMDFKDLYSDFINENLDITEDYRRYWERSTEFTFIGHSYVLNPETKSHFLHIENSLTQQATARETIFMGIFQGELPQPYLVLRIDRQRLIATSLDQLRVPSADMKKQLKIKFSGEDGIDEGGVKKEWFQLLVKELFDPKYGMFTADHKTRTQWFNPASQDFSEFELLGKVLGLAVYNSVILDVHFPSLIYKKLLGQVPTLDDLAEINPDLSRGLKQLLEYEETPEGKVEDVFGLTFQISYEVYGTMEAHALIPDGGNVAVTAANRHQYVQLYSSFLMEDSISTQFKHFKKGFTTVCDSEIFHLFRPAELELLVCGSPELDFEELEKTTEYEGFTKDDITIKNFWSVLHELTLEQKKRFLFFATGTDRVPIGGMARIGLTISRHGEEHRLPSSHTCFAVVLLAPTPNLEKMRQNIHIVLENAEGFGMI